MERSQDWIFYLCLDNKPGNTYYQLASHMQKVGKMLVPVSYDQLQRFFGESGIIDLIIVLRNQEDLKLFQGKMKRYLVFLLKTKKIHVHFVSSYELKSFTENFYKLFFHYYPLPQNLEELTQEIFHIIASRQMQKNSWPGGRRGSFRL